MAIPARRVTPAAAALVGLAGLASAMGIGRFAFTPLLPLMQAAGTVSLSQGGSLARANYLGYLVGAVLSMAVSASPGRSARSGLAAVAVLTAAMGLAASFPAWLALRFLAGIASAFVLVGVSSWALPLLAAHGRAARAGLVYAGVGIGILVCGLVGLAAGVRNVPPSAAWLLLGVGAAGIAIACWSALGVEPSATAPARGGDVAGPRPNATPLVIAYGAFGLGYIVPATFLPAAARLVAPDPAVFAWTWPVFGLAAAASTIAASRAWRTTAPRRLWAGAQVVMAAGVLLPAVSMSIPAVIACALAVGGTFMVVTMAGIQEARRVSAAAAPRRIAAMTAAFALGQLAGPSLVTALGSRSSPDLTLAHVIAAAVLLAGVAALALRLDPAPALTRPLERGERT